MSPQLNSIPSATTTGTQSPTPPLPPPPSLLSNYPPQYNQYVDKSQYYNQYPPLPQAATTNSKTTDLQPVTNSPLTTSSISSSEINITPTNTSSTVDQEEKIEENNSESTLTDESATQVATIIIDNTTNTGENTSQISSSSSSSAVGVSSSSSTSQQSNSQSISPSSLSSCSSSTSSASNASTSSSSYSILKSKDSIQEIDSPSSSSSSSSSLIQHHNNHHQPNYYHNHQHHAHFVNQPYLIYENNQEPSSSSINKNISNSNNKTRFLRLNPNSTSNTNNSYYSTNSGVYITNGSQRLKNNESKSLLNINRKYSNTVTPSSKNIPVNIENLNYTNTKKLYLNNTNTTNNKLPVYNYNHHPQPQVYHFNSRPLSTSNNTNRSNIPGAASVASVSYTSNNKLLKQKNFNSPNLNYIQTYNNSQYFSEFTPHNNTNNHFHSNTYQTNYGKNIYANTIDMDARLRHRGDDNVSPSSLDYDPIMVEEINLSNVGKTVIYNDSIQIREEMEGEVDVEEIDEDEEENGDVFIEINKNLEIYISLLSSIKEPIVCDIEARSSLVRLSPIEAESFFGNKSLSENNKVEVSPITNDDSNEDDGLQKVESTPSADLIAKMLENLNYTLELSSESNKFNKVYTGDANEITLKDLKPNTKYFLR